MCGIIAKRTSNGASTGGNHCERWFGMGLKIMRNADGTIRETWHGRISVKGVKRTTNQNVPIEGTVPTDADGNLLLSAKGDAAFERSRKAAQKAFEKWRKENHEDPAELQRKAYHARTGEDLNGVPLASLYVRWCKVKRERKPTEGWQKMIGKWFGRFAAFAGNYARRNRTRCETINDITPEIAEAWFEEIKKTYSWETVTKMMALMRGAFRRFSTSGRENPFAGIILRGGGSGGNKKISRTPLEAKHLAGVVTLAATQQKCYHTDNR